jgi:hypothetical protein
MPNLVYSVTGQVIDRDTSLGVAGLRLQAWDTNPQRDQILAETKTDENGRFKTSFDLAQFKYETPPDLFFKVFREETLLESTESSVLWNANTQESVTIRVRTGKPREPGKDRVTSDHVFKTVDFFQKSDFKGVLNEYKSRAGTSVGFVADMFVNAFVNLDVEPVRVKGTRQSDIVNQDVEAARRNLAAKNVVVKEVLPYKPGLNSESLKAVSFLPRDLKAGQEVKLYVEEGKVRYYSVVKSTPSTADPALNTHLEAQDAELATLRAELKTTREQAAKKDEQISTLQKQLEVMDKDQKEITTVLKSESFARLMKEMQKPQQPTPKTPLKTPPKTPKGGKR